MVFVPVSEDDAFYLVLIRKKIGVVRNNQIDARHVAVGESASAIDDDDFVAVLKRGHVFAYLAHAAYKYDFKRGFVKILSQNLPP